MFFPFWKAKLQWEPLLPSGILACLDLKASEARGGLEDPGGRDVRKRRHTHQ